MKILYLMTQEPDESIAEIMAEHRKAYEVTVVDLREEKDYGRIIDLISESNSVISW